MAASLLGCGEGGLQGSGVAVRPMLPGMAWLFTGALILSSAVLLWCCLYATYRLLAGGR